MTRDGTVGRFRRNRAKPGVSSGHRSRLNDEDSVRGPHQGQQSTRTAPTGRTHDCKRPLRCTPNDLLPGGGHPHMRRRAFITLLGGAAAAWSLPARAQQQVMPVIGFLSSGFSEAYSPFLVAFRTGLGESGYVEGHNVKIEYRWAEGQFDRLPVLAADLVHHSVAVIVTSGVSSGLAARAATSTTPHVFLSQTDPVKLKFVASFNRPGGNATGVALLTSVLVKKRLELARELVSTAAVIAVLANPNSPEFAAQMSDVQVAAQSLGQQIHVVNAGRDGDFDSAFAALLEQRPGALLVTTDAFLYCCAGNTPRDSCDLRSS